MANEAERVVVELLAKVDGFDVRVKTSATAFDGSMKKIYDSADRAERNVTKSTRNQRREIKKLETEMRGSASKISGSFRALAASVATYFSGRELIGLLDSFTRLQNNLRVAGLEGENLARVQSNLLDIGQRYGVEVETLSTVFLKASLAQKELGASTSQIIQLNEIVAASLKITGTSAAEARGALLQLGQALGSDIVRGEEFNSLLENALPVVQAAARGIDRFGGSVARLRKEVVDGKVASREFFEGILKGGTQTVKDAEKATLTLAGGFTALKNALTVYFGEADKANGVSAALGSALGAVADNLDILIPAISAVIVLIGVRYIAAAAAATASTIALGAAATGTAASMGAMGAAAFALQARLAGAATTTEALTFALGGMKGALATVAVIALGAAVYYVATEMAGAKDAAGAYAQAQREAEGITKKAADAADKLASAHGKARVEALALARAEAENIKQKLASARASVTLAKAELARANVRLTDRIAAAQQTTLLTGQPGGFGAGLIEPGAKANQAQGNLTAAQKTVERLDAALKKIEGAIAAGPPQISAPSVEGKKKTKGGGGRSGPTAAEIQQRFNDELASLAQQTLSAQASQARSAEERAELELRGVELARVRTAAGIKADEDYSKAQKDRLLAQLETLAFEERARIEFDRRRQVEEEQRSIAEERYNAERDQLQLQYDLADTQGERKDLALKIVDAEDRYLTSLLESIIASETATEADKERARIALESLKATSVLRKAGASKDNQTPLEGFLQTIPNTAAEIDEAFESVAAGGLATFTDALTDAIVNFRSLGDVGRAVLQSITADLVRMAIQQVILRTIGQTAGNAAIATTSAQAAAAGAAWAGPAALASLATLGANAGPAAAALASTTALAAALGAVPKKDGGPIFGPGGPRDDKVLMAASPGEYVIKARSAAKLGRQALDYLNLTGELPGFRDGGAIRSVRPSNAPAATRDGGMASLSPDAVRQLEGVVTRAASAMPDVKLYPTLDPARAFEAMLNSPGGQRAFFNFVGQNSRKFKSQLDS